MSKRYILAFGSLLLPLIAAAQEFRPFPTARITEPQWQSYFEDVEKRHGASIRHLPAQHLVVFEDQDTATTYAFTQAGHPAHPAWIARRVVLEGVLTIQQIGYFAGDEQAFTELLHAPLALNEGIRPDTPQRPAENPKQ